MSYDICDAAKENLALLLQRVEDSKTNVRKSALQVLDRFMFLNHIVCISHFLYLFIFPNSRLAHVTFNLHALLCLHRLWWVS